MLAPLLAGTAAAVVTTSVDPRNLPIGKTVSTSAPARGSVYACSIMSGGGGAFASGSWIHADGTYDATAKPAVEGNVAWPSVVVSFTIAGGRLTVKDNGSPKGTHTGVSPVAAASTAYQYDRNPNTISATVAWRNAVRVLEPG